MHTAGHRVRLPVMLDAHAVEARGGRGPGGAPGDDPAGPVLHRQTSRAVEVHTDAASLAVAKHTAAGDLDVPVAVARRVDLDRRAAV